MEAAGKGATGPPGERQAEAVPTLSISIARRIFPRVLRLRSGREAPRALGPQAQSGGTGAPGEIPALALTSLPTGAGVGKAVM